MKIVLLPGVRIYEPKPKHEYFLKTITTKLGCEGEIFTWEPGYIHPEYNLPLKTVRDFVYEVILDFQGAITCAIETVVPSADFYIGHSAGSIVALLQQKPTVVMASPAPLVNLIKRNKINNKRANDLADLMLRDPYMPILNIVNKYDVLACLFDKSNIEDYQYTGKWFNPLSYFPVTAHSDYWTNIEVINKIVQTIQKWS
jgi:hypothetical protein